MTSPHKIKRSLQIAGQQLLTDYQQLDEAIAQVLTTNPASCTPKCTACCKQLVQATPKEIAAIAIKYPEALKRAQPLFAKHARKLYEMMAHIFTTFQLDAHEYREKSEQLADLWWTTQTDCAFLHNNLCTVYEARPVACRAYYVRSPKEDCYNIEKTSVEVFQFVAVHQLQLELILQDNGNMHVSYLPPLAAAFDS